jgi:hypothetical protein
MKSVPQNRGIALLITLLLTSVLLGVSTSLLNITLKQYLFANIGIASETAFHAANSGMECILFHDFDGYHDVPPRSPFDVNANGSPTTSETGIGCMGDTSDDIEDNGANDVVSGDPQVFRFSWGDPEMCSIVTIYKFASDSADEDMSGALGVSNPVLCAENTVCTIVRSRGYNASCLDVQNNTGRILERELIQRY